MNEERYIRRCVESLLAAEYPAERVEFLFVDNGSSDRGTEILREYPRVTVLHEPRGMAYTARNAAIAVASGRVVAFTDADCEVDPLWLQTIHEAILDEGARIAMGPVTFPRPRSALLEVLETYRNDHIEYVIANRIWNHLYGYTNNMAVCADVFARLGPLEELPVPGDTEILHRCLARLPDTVIAFRQAMRVEHLEIVNARALFRKLIYYGELDTHWPTSHDRPHHRGSSGAESYTARRNRFLLRRHLLFQVGLKTSNACLWYGNCRGRLKRAWGKLRSAPV